MKNIMAAAFVGASLFAAAWPLKALDDFQQNARLGRGVNILGWDALWQDRAQGQFKDVHFKLIREAGFNHVRINLHPLRDGKPDSNGKLRDEFLKIMDWAVDQALANGLLVILDFHDDLAISPDPEGKKKDFLDSWTRIAEHCKNRPDTVLFEILNEPAPKFTHESWNEYWRAALAVIRKSNPNRTVIVGPAQWNGVGELDNLKLPADDRNIIATVHFYNPFPFTHQGTPWTGQKDKTGVTWNGTESEVKAMEMEFSKVADWAKRNHRPIYIGEFGTYEKAEMPARVRWAACVARQFEKAGWSWCCWQFADNFALFDMRTQKWVEPLRDALIPKKKDSIWDMEALAKAPQWTALERPKADAVKAVTYIGLPFRGKPTRVFAWLGVPKVKDGEKVPAMVLIHGGGGTAFDEWVRLWTGRGYAAIAMDTCGQIPVGNYGQWIRDEQSGPPGWGGFDQMDWPREDQWTHHAVADAILAHSLIRSLPEVDPDRTGVTGISWGGYLTCIVAGVDHRFKLAVPVYGCGFYRDTFFEDSLKKMGPELAERWMAWWDPSVYLGSAEAPLLWVTGSNDFAYTMNALQSSYRLPKGPRTLCIRLRMPHAHGGPGENPEEIRVFAGSILKGEPALPAITGSGREGNKVWATYAAKVPVVKGELNYTTDTNRWQDRKWESIDAALTGGRVAASLPEGTRVYYFNLFDQRNCVVSTEHEEFRSP